MGGRTCRVVGGRTRGTRTEAGVSDKVGRRSPSDPGGLSPAPGGPSLGTGPT